MSADRLREAARVLRERAEAASSGPWVAFDSHDEHYNTQDEAGWWWVWRKDALPFYGGVMEMQSHPADCVVGACESTDGHSGEKERKDAEFIATMDPELAGDLADWLDHEASRVGRTLDGATGHAWLAPNPSALAIADKILGGES